jgi:branched-chain amino acid transport system substrate-binding protein
LKGRRIVKHLSVRLAVVTAGFCAILAQASVAQDAGITERTIKIGSWGPLSGPVSLLGESMRDGLRVCAREVNDSGGVNGRTLELVVYDDAGSPQEAQAAIRRLLDQDQVFMLLGGSTSGSTLPVRHVISRRKVPFIASISSNMNLMDPFSRYIFRIYANEISQAQSITDWMIEHEGIKRPAIIYNSNDYGVGGYKVFSERLKKKYDMTPVAAERYNPGDQDFSAQLLSIKQANPDGLLVFSFAAEAGIIVRQANELGLTTKMFGGGGTATTLFQRGAGKAAKGFVADFVLPQFPESDHPKVVAYREMLSKWFYPNGFPPGRPSEYDLAAYGACQVALEAFRRVGKELTREKVIDALERFDKFDIGVIFPVSYSPDNHEATDQVLIIHVNDNLEWTRHPKAKSKGE